MEATTSESPSRTHWTDQIGKAQAGSISIGQIREYVINQRRDCNEPIDLARVRAQVLQEVEDELAFLKLGEVIQRKIKRKSRFEPLEDFLKRKKLVRHQLGLIK